MFADFVVWGILVHFLSYYGSGDVVGVDVASDYEYR